MLYSLKMFPSIILKESFEVVQEAMGLRNVFRYEEGILRKNVIRMVVLLHDLQIMSHFQKLVWHSSSKEISEYHK